jgi:hypothetical protein
MGAQPASPEPTGFAQPWLKVSWTHTLAQMDETRVMASALELNNGVWRPLEGAMPELAVGEKRVMGLTVASGYLQIDVAGVVEVDPANPQNGFVTLDLRALGGSYLSGGAHLLEAMDGSAGQAVFKPGSQGSAVNPLIERLCGCISVSPYTGPETLLPGIFSPVVVRNTLPSNTGCGSTALLRASVTQATHVKPVSYTGDWTQELARDSLSLSYPTMSPSAQQDALTLGGCIVKATFEGWSIVPVLIRSTESALLRTDVIVEPVLPASPGLRAIGDEQPPVLVRVTMEQLDGSMMVTFSRDGTPGTNSDSKEVTFGNPAGFILHAA